MSLKKETRISFGRRVMVGIHSPVITDYTKSLITDFEPHIIIFAGAIESKNKLTQLIKYIKSLYKHNTPIITIDVEGGKINRFKNKPGFEDVALLSAKEMADKGEDVTFGEGLKVGRAFKDVGAHSPLGPVLDCNYGCPAISDLGRSFGTDPQKVYELAQIWSVGLNEHGIIPCGKHLWGHGSAKEDTHKSSSKMEDDLFEQEVEAFKLAFTHGFLPMVMTSHLHCPQIDPYLPCSLSKKCLDYARELGFDGCFITDDIFMKALSVAYTLAQIYQLAFNAGTEIMILGKPDYAPDYFQISMYEMLEQGAEMLEQGLFDSETWNQSDLRVKKLVKDLN